MGWVIVRKDDSCWLKLRCHHPPPGAFLKALEFPQGVADRLKQIIDQLDQRPCVVLFNKVVGIHWLFLTCLVTREMATKAVRVGTFGIPVCKVKCFPQKEEEQASQHSLFKVSSAKLMRTAFFSQSQIAVSQGKWILCCGGMRIVKMLLLLLCPVLQLLVYSFLASLFFFPKYSFSKLSEETLQTQRTLSDFCYLVENSMFKYQNRLMRFGNRSPRLASIFETGPNTTSRCEVSL